MTRCGDDRFKSAVHIVENVAIPEAEDEETERFKLSCSPCVVSTPFNVLSAINLDNEAS